MPNELSVAVIQEFHNKLNRCSKSQDFDNLFEKYKGYDHPYIFMVAGSVYGTHKDHEKSINNYLSALSYGLSMPNEYYLTQHADTIGGSIARILYHYKIEGDADTIQKMYYLAYCYLTSCINLLGMNAFESLKYRGNILGMNNQYMAEFVGKYLGMGVLPMPLAISDLYLAYGGYKKRGYHDEAEESIQNAIRLHKWLEDISINGKNADEWSIQEIAEIGLERNKILFENMKADFVKNKFTIDFKSLKDRIKVKF